MTQEEIDRHISAAFDSVNLITALRALISLDSEQTSSLNRNVEHLQIMMAQEWFSVALSLQQTNEINAAING